MLSVGLDRGEARLISAVAPCLALLGPAIVGPLVDKLSVGRGSTGGSGSTSGGSGKVLRVLTATCLVLCAIFYLLLLAVPHTERHKARRPQVLFMCDEHKAYVLQEVCTEGMRCNHWTGVKKGVLAVSACEYSCLSNSTWLSDPFPVTTISPGDDEYQYDQLLPIGEEEDEDNYEVNPPHLCTDGSCLVYMKHTARMRVPLALQSAAPATLGDSWCNYTTADHFQCIVPSDIYDDLLLIEKDCNPIVRCRVVDPYDEPGGVLADAQCRLVIGDPTYTFWVYFVIRCVADIWPTAALALLGAACVIATRETSLGRGDVGRQLAFGTIGLAIFPPLAGLGAKAVPEAPYLVPFAMNAIFMIIAALILLFDSRMPLSTPEWWWHTATGVLAMPMNTIRRYGAEIAGLFAVVTLLGALWSAIDAYLPWTVMDLNVNNTDTLVGLTLTVGALPAIPALWWAEVVVDYVGHSNVLIMAFTFYCLRYTGLAYTTDYTWVVVCEALEVFTLSLVWVTAVLYFRHLVPKKYTVTGQALPVIAHFCIGRCIGAIVGGLVTLEDPLESARQINRGLAVFSLLVAAIYLALYHFVLAPRCAAPTTSPPQTLLQGLNTNGSSNGAYSPMRVYHEERSRKGHFRY